MKKERDHGRYSWTDAVLESPVGCFIIAAVAIFMGIIFIVTQSDNKPVSREEAIAYSGELESYETGKNYSGIKLSDETYLDIYPHTQSGEFIDIMKSLPKGTKLYALVNPNNNCIAELRTDTLELMNFEASQQEIDKYDNGYIVIGIVVEVGAVFFIAYGISLSCHKKSQQKRAMKKKSGAIRYANGVEKGRILLEAKSQGLEICYRRVKHVNELVVNGKVYDEIKGIFEFEHKLTAKVGEHTVEAGLTSENYSYIRLNGKLLKEKRRLI